MKIYTIYSEIKNVTYIDEEGTLKKKEYKYFNWNPKLEILSYERSYKSYVIEDGYPSFIDNGTIEDLRTIRGYYITLNRKPTYIRCSQNTTPKILKIIYPEFSVNANFTLTKNSI